MVTNISNIEKNCVVLKNTKNLSREEWLKLRKSSIGGSDVGAIFNASPYMTMRDLYYKKINVKEFKKRNESFVPLEYGNALEELVGKIFSMKTGLSLLKDTNMYQSIRYPFMTANVDYFIKMKDGSIAILECKTCSYFSKDKWSENKIPYHYELQMRHYMAVMGIEKAFIACLYDNNEDSFFIREVSRDMEIENTIITLEKYFWENFILKRNEPPFFEDSKMCLNTIKSHNESKNTSVILDDEKSTLLVQKYLEQEAKIKEMDKNLKKEKEKLGKIQVSIISYLENSSYGKVEIDGSNYLVSNAIRTTTTVKKDVLKTRYPDIFEETKNVSESLKFSIKKIKNKKSKGKVS